MKQQRLPLKRDKPLPAQRKAADEANLGTAKIILERPDKYQGLQVQWAERVMANHQAALGKRTTGL